MSSSLAVTFGHIFKRSATGSAPVSSQCMNGTAVGGDGGTSLVLGLDVAAFVVCILLFLLIRCCCRSYSQMGFASRKQWSMEFHKHQTTPLLNKRDSQTSEEEYDSHWYSWLHNVFYKLQDSEICSRCGPDAVLYLTLERYLIVLLTVFSLFSVVIVLPINYLQGNLLTVGFDRTTIANIDARSSVLWVHTIFSLLYLFVVIIFMIHYALRLGKLRELNSTHTVMIQWIPRIVQREDLRQHFQESLPGVQVEDIQIACDVSALTKLHQKQLNMQHKLRIAQCAISELNKHLVYRTGWGKVLFWNKKYQVDAMEYYDRELKAVTLALDAEKVHALEKGLGTSFVTFSNPSGAAEFCHSYKLFQHKPESSLSDCIRSKHWWVSMAPFPLDIIWENLSVLHREWLIRWCLINIPLFIFLFFFTTPSIVVAGIDDIRRKLQIPDLQKSNITVIDATTSFISLYLPNLLLLLFSSLMPYLVAKSCSLEAHWTKSFREQTIMRKTFFFLALMQVLLPSVGLTSLDAVAAVAFNSTSVQMRLSCIFLPGNGAFFVSYVITSALVGTGFELIRLPELLEYIIRRLFARTSVQKRKAMEKISEYAFAYGVQYAWNLVIFAMVMTYSLTAPLIVPAGLLYFVLKLYIDKYNIFYVYHPTAFHGRQFLHKSAVNFVVLGAVLLQLSILFFSVVRLGYLDPRSKFMIFTFVVTGVLCCGVMVFGWFSHLVPKIQCIACKVNFPSFLQFPPINPDAQPDDEVVVKGAYVAPVLKAVQSGSNIEKTSEEGYLSFDSLGHESSGDQWMASSQSNVRGDDVAPVQL